MSDQVRHWVSATRSGNFERAWAISSEILAARDPATRDDPAVPYHLRWVWDGRAIDGRDVLVRCYHGLGDTIQFARYLPLLARRAASVTLEVQPRLVELLSSLPGLSKVIPFDPAKPTPPFACDIEITELPFALRALPSAWSVPYLRSAPAVLPPGAIGLCYASGDWDADRSLPPGLFERLCVDRSAISLVAEPTSLPVLNPDGCPFDIDATAALVAGVDLVITVDTMIAHLAGALGKPVWLLLKHEPDWRWPNNGDRTAWYPQMRLYRQPKHGDWSSVVVQVAADLAARDARTAEQQGYRVSEATVPHIPVSWGELLDKITILEIKCERIADPAARANVAKECALLSAIGGDAMRRRDIASTLRQLKAVNEELWDIEDEIRAHEARGAFGARFVELARSVYKKNDERAALKRAINISLNSDLIEEKSYDSSVGRPLIEAG